MKMIMIILMMIMLKLMIMVEKIMMVMSCAAGTFEAWLAPAGVMSRRLREAGGVHVAPWEHAVADF